MRRRRFYRKCREWLPPFCVAFGCGILCALLFSLKFALLVAAVFLIAMGRARR